MTDKEKCECGHSQADHNKFTTTEDNKGNREITMQGACKICSCKRFNPPE